MPDDKKAKPRGLNPTSDFSGFPGQNYKVYRTKSDNFVYLDAEGTPVGATDLHGRIINIPTDFSKEDS